MISDTSDIAPANAPCNTDSSSQWMPMAVHVCYHKNTVKEFTQASNKVVFKYKLQRLN